MPYIGETNLLTILHKAAPGIYLDGEDMGQILLPNRYCTSLMVPGGAIDVFLYRDSEDRVIATTDRPHAQVGEFAGLKVVSINPRMGAFLDWGLDKDLLLPNREWAGQVRVGETVVVLVRLDERSDRVVATARIDRHLDLDDEVGFAPRQAVDLIIASETPLGYKAIVDQTHTGLLYRSDLSAPLEIGQRMRGFVGRPRPDGKLDLTLHESGYQRVEPLSDQLLARLRKSDDGFLPFHDKSPPDEIQREFGVSKKAFKQAVGNLYRERKITLESDGIRLVV
ncbi:MAG: S1-like domain-containing RNA-binding protein [Synoicihabitans sp.]